MKFLHHTQTHKPGRTPERVTNSTHWPLPAQHKTNTREEQSTAGFEPAIPKLEWYQIYSLDSTATGIMPNILQHCSVFFVFVSTASLLPKQVPASGNILYMLRWLFHKSILSAGDLLKAIQGETSPSCFNTPRCHPIFHSSVIYHSFIHALPYHQ